MDLTWRDMKEILEVDNPLLDSTDIDVSLLIQVSGTDQRSLLIHGHRGLDLDIPSQSGGVNPGRRGWLHHWVSLHLLRQELHLVTLVYLSTLPSNESFNLATQFLWLGLDLHQTGLLRLPLLLGTSVLLMIWRVMAPPWFQQTIQVPFELIYGGGVRGFGGKVVGCLVEMVLHREEGRRRFKGRFGGLWNGGGRTSRR